MIQKTYKVINRETGHAEYWFRNGFNDTPHTEFDIDTVERKYLKFKAKYRIEEWIDGECVNLDAFPPSDQDILDKKEEDEFLTEWNKYNNHEDVFERMAHNMEGVWRFFYRKTYIRIAAERNS